MKLAFIGSINDEILLTDELALDLIKHISPRYGAVIKERYSIENMGTPLEVLSGIALNRRCFKKGEELDLEKAAGMFVEDFRSGKLGRISLEWPEEFTK